jgi:phosphoribosylformylglycinamidine cyclo-ligase
VAVEVVKGIAKGCDMSNCSLIGGETAEMPGLYSPGDYDMAGFVVGIAERKTLIDGSEIRDGDQIIGLASNGLHSNGFSLVRKIFFEEMGLTVNDQVKELGCTLGEELLKPTRIYTETLLNVFRNFKVNGVVHITGGGIIDNIPRVLPQGCKAVINDNSWPVPPVFKLLKEKGGISAKEMFRIFNCGIGMAVIIDAKLVEDVLRQLTALGESPFVIGSVTADHVDRDNEAPSIEIV